MLWSDTTVVWGIYCAFQPHDRAMTGIPWRHFFKIHVFLWIKWLEISPAPRSLIRPVQEKHSDICQHTAGSHFMSLVPWASTEQKNVADSHTWRAECLKEREIAQRQMVNSGRRVLLAAKYCALTANIPEDRTLIPPRTLKMIGFDTSHGRIGMRWDVWFILCPNIFFAYKALGS